MKAELIKGLRALISRIKHQNCKSGMAAVRAAIVEAEGISPGR